MAYLLLTSVSKIEERGDGETGRRERESEEREDEETGRRERESEEREDMATDGR